MDKLVYISLKYLACLDYNLQDLNHDLSATYQTQYPNIEYNTVVVVVAVDLSRLAHFVGYWRNKMPPSKVVGHLYRASGDMLAVVIGHF